MLSLHTNLMASNAARNLAAHYGGLAASVRRLSSGLRVGTAADDAAGLAIREQMRADIASLSQGIRNANDAVSLIQTADGALAIIDEKLIRMKELAEQAATGTYTSDQRLMIDSEFQAMAREINRIATATDFNGVKLLDGSLSGEHDGSRLESTGALKVHFGSGNDAAEDYYYIAVGDATLHGLGLAASGGGGGGGTIGGVDILGNILVNGGSMANFTSGIISFAVIPAGTQNLRIHIDDGNINDSIEIFARSGIHLAGTTVTKDSWDQAKVRSEAAMNSMVITEANGFLPGAVYDYTYLNGIGADLPRSNYTPGAAGNTFSYNGMQIGYSGEGNEGQWYPSTNEHDEYLTIDQVTEDLVLIIGGGGIFNIQASWNYMPGSGGEPAAAISIRTQALAQKALERIDDAIIAKDKIRAHLGAMQNRLENTMSNLQIQAENIQAAESRISDVDVADEMTEFVRSQVLTQSATAMIVQANSLPGIIAKLLE